MDHKRKFYYGLVVVLSSVFTDLQAGMIDKEGMAPYEICGMCHSLNGISRMSKFPKLAGQKSAYLKYQLLDFMQGRRLNDGGQMAAIVTEINPLDIDEIVAYFSGLPRPKDHELARSDIDYEDFQAGKKLFESGRVGLTACSTCHNDVVATAPHLKGQHGDYIRKQLNDFKEGNRVSDRSAMMSAIASALTKDEVDKLAVFLEESGRY
jgi:cytochrome c553